MTDQQIGGAKCPIKWSQLTNSNKSGTVNITQHSEERTCRYCWSVKAIIITYSECVSVALGSQHEIRMRHNVICGLPRYTKCFPHYITNGNIFEKKLLNTKFVFRFSLQLLSETFHTVIRNERDMIKNVYRSSFKYRAFLFHINQNRIFLEIHVSTDKTDKFLVTIKWKVYYLVTWIY